MRARTASMLISRTLLPQHNRMRWPLWVCVLPLAGCTGAQSTLAPAGREAERIANLFWWMTAGSIVVWLAVLMLAFYAARAGGEVDRSRQARMLILMGALVPTVVLGGLLIYGLSMLPSMVAPAPQSALRISVYGEQWWWRIRYEPPGRQAFETANEVHLPVGEPAEFRLHSTNVIHSFWIPSLGGKVDLIPGRVNRLVLNPTRTGRFRGTCAEYCGNGHANMALEAIVVERQEFVRWLEDQSKPAVSPAMQGTIE